ncbi:bifunctional anthranilate synthase component II/anthranilate phosphoribosyltransferase [Spirochaeta lutea]|uniref:Anthranilate phosphoribosyltransferase n=1 Tax=Spirochaeta lutea TaxID=1480694 RepID=A0A098QVM9_9SPIO|nr:bifunctional anthranilate synthase component II/anthranilate phosphoribosyltransferase [Spirochaeta lutea]KGE71636.1 glutamine amidotransferase [Spirochaeta lutea]
MIVLIDNYDSFTHNLYQYLTEITSLEVRVVRNDRIDVQGIRRWKPSHIIISPGPGRPEDAGISLEVVKAFAGELPILGVCLGHQAIAQAFGARIVSAQEIVHGKAEPITLDGKGLFRAIPSPGVFTRYHSLAVEESTLGEEFEITARADDGEIMGIRHREFVLEGVQFHPESIASEYGKTLLRNFLNYRRQPFVGAQLLSAISRGEDLTAEQAESFMEELTEGNLSDIQIAGFLTALNTKGIAADEIAGCARVLQRKRVKITSSKPCLDTCGTGGDGLGTFNISSLSALVASACGARVAKHGNRAVSSRSGSAEFYKALGFVIELSPGDTSALLERNDFAFLFAPTYHGAMRFAAPARRELKVKTIMNLLGPLANPAAADYQLIGVYSEDLCPVIARAAHMLGIKRGMVVHGRDGEDELSVVTTSRVVEFDEQGRLTSYDFDPASIGISGFTIDDLIGGDADLNAELARQVVRGQGVAAIRESVCLNAGAALKLYGLAGSIKEGYQIAKAALQSGKVARKIEDTIFLSRRLREEAEAAEAGESDKSLQSTGGRVS